jgi:hypothetical protein
MLKNTSQLIVDLPCLYGLDFVLSKFVGT